MWLVMTTILPGLKRYPPDEDLVAEPMEVSKYTVGFTVTSTPCQLRGPWFRWTAVWVTRPHRIVYLTGHQSVFGFFCSAFLLATPLVSNIISPPIGDQGNITFFFISYACAIQTSTYFVCVYHVQQQRRHVLTLPLKTLLKYGSKYDYMGGDEGEDITFNASLDTALSESFITWCYHITPPPQGGQV